MKAQNVFLLIICLLLISCNNITFKKEDVVKRFNEAAANPAYQKALYGTEALNWKASDVQEVCATLAPTAERKYKICYAVVLKNGNRMFMIEGEPILYCYTAQKLLYTYGAPTAIQMKDGRWLPAISQTDSKLCGYRTNTSSPYGNVIFMDMPISLENALQQLGLEQKVETCMLPRLVDK